MSPSGKPSIINQIIELLYTEGPMDVSTMCKTIPYPYKSVYTKACDLRKMGFATKDGDGIWHLASGITPRTLETGELDSEPGAEPGEEVSETATSKAPLTRSPGMPLDQQQLFIQELRNIGVTPKEAIPTIANIFFSGDIDKLSWLNKVLKEESAGFVTHKQRRLIFSWWSHTRGLPYTEDEFFPDGEDTDEGKRPGARAKKEEPVKGKPLDPGMGWKIEKDKDGDWVPIAGGPLETYSEALDAARERQLISAYAKQQADNGEGEDEGVSETGTRKGPKRQETLVEYMMKKVVDSMFDGAKGKGTEESETVRKLTERIETMEKEREEERFERLEGMVAQIAARDPWDDYARIEEMKQRLGVGGPVVTDQSPAVQLLKDTTDKMDKNVNRLVGLIERTMLRSDEFLPEQTRSAQQRETKAKEILSEVESRGHSRDLRKRTFGV